MLRFYRSTVGKKVIMAVTGLIGIGFVPEGTSNVALYAMLGMAAMMAASLQAPLSALVATVELTGNPQARQGTNEVKGGRIVFDLVNDVVEVKEKVQTTFESNGALPAKTGGK